MALTSTRTYVARSGTGATVTTTVPLAAATAKTVVAVMGTAGTSIALERVSVSFASSTGTDGPATLEIGVITALGTVTSFTPVQATGVAIASLCSAGYNATVEPTYSKVVHAMYIPVFNGTVVEWMPMGFEVACAASQGLAIRVTSPSATNCLASILYSE